MRMRALVLATTLTAAGLAGIAAPAVSRRARQRGRGHRSASSRPRAATATGPSAVRCARGPQGRLEVRLPGGTWIECGRSCADTLRRETVDFWRNHGGGGPRAEAPTARATSGSSSDAFAAGRNPRHEVRRCRSCVGPAYVACAQSLRDARAVDGRVEIAAGALEAGLPVAQVAVHPQAALVAVAPLQSVEDVARAPRSGAGCPADC